SPVKGQLWMDSTNNLLKWWDGTQWVTAAGGAPSGPAGGELTGTHPNPPPGAGKATSTAIPHGTLAGVDTATPFDVSTLAAAHPTSGNLNMNGHYINNVLDPVGSSDAATKNYVDQAAQGLDAKQSVRAMSTSLVGGTAAGAQTVDGVSI